MVKKHTHTKKHTIIALLLFGIIFFNLITSTMVLNAYEKYNIALEKGTHIRVINYYDAQAWNATVSVDFSPNDWFGGEADSAGAKSKTVVLGWGHNDISTYSMFKFFMIPRNYLSTFLAIQDHGYNYTHIMSKYTRYYLVWEKYFAFRSFTLNGFSNVSDFLKQNSFIFRYPENFSKALEDYNNFSMLVNNDTTLQSLGYSLPILNGDDFLWQFILECFTLGNPINNYLKTLIESLKCKNVRVQGNTLIIQRNGITNYTAEVTYNNQGNLETFLIKNSNEIIIYKITSYYPKIPIIIIIGICCLSILVLTTIYFLFYKRKYRK